MENWQQRFDKKFRQELFGEPDRWITRLKDFISQEIQSAREEAVQDFIKRLAIANDNDEVLPEVRKFTAFLLKSK